MGMSQLCGVIGDALSKLVDKFFQYIVQPILVGLSSMALKLIGNVLAVFGYAISVFLLSLIDFIEALFNALSGLNNTASNGITINFGNNQQGDLLLQAITSPVVLNVFYATAVVGIFLLIITTIFQMIKVEYTTEGAQNSKTGILGKSLKSLTNMLIIPLLVIFGIVIGNQVLGLINTATKGNANAKISGTLWVTAASPALLAGEGNKVAGLIGPASTFSTSILYTVGLMDAVVYGVTQANSVSAKNFGWDNAAEFLDRVSIFGLKAEPNRTQLTGAEEGFETVGNGYKYYNLKDVCTYYNIFDVNYFVLLFAACIIIKCLYHICFGMIDRLYQCVALFIVMPMVVGMSPVKDSLGSWRQKFIGKALSAYGIVISMNLFFVISKLFLNLEVKVSGPVGALSGMFLTGIIKAIFLIVGCLMIEKLSADMGSYFGAADGLGEGKKLASDVGKTVQKGIASAAMVGMAVASGGASLAAGASGLAAKLGAKAGAKALTGQVAGAAANKASAASKFNTALNKITGGNVDERFTNFSKAASEREMQQGIMNDAKAHMDAASSTITDQEKILNDKNSTFEQRNEARAKIAAAEADLDKYGKINADARTKKVAASKEMESISGDQKDKFNDAYNAKKTSDTANAEYDSLSAKKAKQEADEKEAKETKAANRKAWVATRVEGLREYGKNKFGIKAIGEKILGKEVMGIGKDMEAATKAANDTDEGKQMLANIEAAKGKKKNDDYNVRHANIISEQQRIVTSRISSAVIEKVEFNEKSTNLNLDKLARAYNNQNDEKGRDYIYEQMLAVNPNIRRPGENETFEINDNATYHIKLDISDLKRNLQDAINRSAKTDEINQIVAEQLAKWGQSQNEKLIGEIQKIITELRNTLAK